MYKEVWVAAVGEVLICEQEPDNASLPVKREGTTVGHLPQKLTRVCSLILRQGNLYNNWTQEIFS